ncbi:MAG TPA: tandem-95 repeat protein, partial [Pirellulaceae bacterium]
SVTFRAWDQTSGSAGTTVDVSTNGGTTAYSTATATSNITVTSVNDAPVLAGANNFTTISEDQTSNTGDLVSTLISGQVSDVDSGAVNGIAMTGLTSGTGTWQYSTDNGSTWTAVGSVSDSSALLLRSSDKLRLIPDGQNATSGSVTFRAWDQTSGSNGTTVDVSANGGTTAYSTATATSNITVTSVNDAPVLAGANNFTTISEDQTANGGDLISTLIGGQVSDVDSGAVNGIAVTGLTSGTGTWQYSTDNGSTWTAVGSVSDSSALLLRSTDKLRLVPDGQNATTGSVTFRAWDQTSGSAGTNVDVSTNGGTTAYSTATATSNITVTAVNDAPVVTAPAAAVTDENVSLMLSAARGNAITLSDCDVGGGTMTLTLNVTHGTLTLGQTTGVTITSGANNSATMSVSGTLANLNAALDGLQYRPTTYYYGGDALSIVLNDGGNTGTGGPLAGSGTVAITVNHVNQTPQANSASFTLNNDVQLVAAAPGILANCTDIDNDPLQAILVTSPDHGTLAMQSDGSFVYTPDVNFIGTVTFTYKAFDGSLASSVATVQIVVQAHAGPLNYTTMPTATTVQQGPDNENVNSQSTAVINLATQTASATTPPTAAAPTEHHQAATHTIQAQLSGPITNLVDQSAAGPAVLVIKDLKDEAALHGHSQLLVMPAQQQSANVRTESIAVQITKSPAATPLSAKSAESRGSIADRGVDSIAGSDETTFHQSPIEIAANFEHTEYVDANKPSVSVELAVGYALAVFSAAQLTTKSLAAVGSNLIHSPVFHAAGLNHPDEAEDGQA